MKEGGERAEREGERAWGNEERWADAKNKQQRKRKASERTKKEECWVDEHRGFELFPHLENSRHYKSRCLKSNCTVAGLDLKTSAVLKIVVIHQELFLTVCRLFSFLISKQAAAKQCMDVLLIDKCDKWLLKCDPFNIKTCPLTYF